MSHDLDGTELVIRDKEGRPLRFRLDQDRLADLLNGIHARLAELERRSSRGEPLDGGNPSVIALIRAARETLDGKSLNSDYSLFKLNAALKPFEGVE